MKTTNENLNFTNDVQEKEKSVQIAKNAKSAKNLEKKSLNDLIKNETKSAKQSYTIFRKYVADSLKDGNYNFNQVIEFLKTEKGKTYISELNKLNLSNTVQINQFNYNLFKNSSLFINYNDEFNFLQVCRITEKNCINNEGETDFLYNEMFEDVISEDVLLEKIHLPSYNVKVLDGFKFETNGIFKGYFVKPSTEKVNGIIQVKKDKDGNEIIFGVKMKYEQKPVLTILKEMHQEILAKKKLADVKRLELLKEKQDTEKAEAEKAKAEAKAETEKERKAKAELKAKIKAEAEAKAKAKAEAKSIIAEAVTLAEAELKAEAEAKAKAKAEARAKAEAEAKAIEKELIHG